MKHQEYQIFAALAGDVHVGWVWVGKSNLSFRTVIRLTCIDTGKKVWCESIPIDRSFLRRYNQFPRRRIDKPNSSLVISGWYRKLLGNLQTGHKVKIRIDPCHNLNLYGRLRASLQHPDNVVRLATWLGMISLVLGSVGAVFGFISFFG